MSDDGTNDVLEPYREKTKVRSFKIQVKDGHSFYANHYLLADQSPVFEKMFFGDFKEASDQEAQLPDESVDSLNLLFSTLGMGYPVPGEISDDGIFELLRMAHMYDMAGLRKMCTDYIRKRVGTKETVKSEELIWMCTLLQFLINDGHEDYKEVKLDIADSLASAKLSELINITIWDKISEFQYLKEIIETSAKNTELFKNDRHVMDCFYPSHVYCYLCPNVRNKGLIRCSKCEKDLCATHFGSNCSHREKLKINRKLFK